MQYQCGIYIYVYTLYIPSHLDIITKWGNISIMIIMGK